MAEWLDAAAADAAEENEVLGVAGGTAPVALFRIGADVFGLHDQCSHGMARCRPAAHPHFAWIATERD